MKYIRTKDGIIDFAICEEMVINGIKGLYISKDGHNSFVQLEDIIEQADTIEELCDEFVCEKQLARGFKYRGAISYFRALRLKSDIYGAIWADKGLIYVAKMNDKGELELL